MSAAFFYLSRDATAYKRLVSEIRECFSSGKELRQGTQLSACTYLCAVINEALRLPTGAISNWRIQVVPSISCAILSIIPNRWRSARSAGSLRTTTSSGARQCGARLFHFLWVPAPVQARPWYISSSVSRSRGRCSTSTLRRPPEKLASEVRCLVRLVSLNWKIARLWDTTARICS